MRECRTPRDLFISKTVKLRVEEFLQQTKNLKNLQKLHEQKEKAAAQALEVDRKTSQIPLFKPKPILPQRLDTTPAVEKFLATIPSDDPVKAMHCLRTQFVKDFAVLEDRAVKEYQNFWDMRVRNTDIVAHFSLKPYSLAETTQMAWQSYKFLRSLENPIFEYDVAKRLLIVVETDWSMQDKLFEIQKMVAKLPKETFLILKSTLTHLCRICVVQKSDHHLFRPLSNVFAPVMMRIPSRKNSVQREEEYLARNPSQSIYNRDSIVSNRTRNMDSEDARKCEGTQAEDENQSYDSLSNWKDNESSIVEIGPSSNAEVDFLETKAIEAATNQAIESDAKPTDENYPKTESKAASTAITNESATTRGGGRTTVASSSLAIEPRYPHSIVSRSTRHGKRHRYSKTVISTMHTGIASSAPEIENLWDDLDHVKHSIGFRSPTNDPSARESRITVPNSNSIVIPAASPFSRASIVSRKAEEDEEQFNEWVQNQMAQAAKLYRERKYPESKIQGAVVDKPQEKLPQPNRLPRPLLQVPDGEWSDSAKNLFSMEDPEDSDMMPQVFTELICAGIKIIITPPPALDQEEIISEYYMANSLRDENVSASHLEELMDSLTADPTIPSETVIDAAAVQDEKEPETITAPDVPQPVIPEPSKLTEQNTSFGNLEFGTGDVDGFGWNWMTQKKLATQLFLTEECQTASAALLELMLKNLDVIFDWNMYIASERARADLHSINL
ncbi:hypothetical protein BDR26DRAFT_859488 [Obelidium mucronatum]|nr:hypothetical protein BDR26DRAFT_859488 [Obelidium mucronatum]